jgi:hypothetical protein
MYFLCYLFPWKVVSVNMHLYCYLSLMRILPGNVEAWHALYSGYAISKKKNISSLLHYTMVPLVNGTLFLSRELLHSLNDCTLELVGL